MIENNNITNGIKCNLLYRIFGCNFKTLGPKKRKKKNRNDTN